jgi:pimeloyl-ACP methyl ester carboxylesterase
MYGPEFGPKRAGEFYDFRLPECDINQDLALLAEISAPTLIVAGDRDAFFPVFIPIAMKQTIPEAELFIYPGTGHIVMEHFPEMVAELAVSFFARKEVKA